MTDLRYRVRAWGVDREWTVPPLEDFRHRDNAEIRADWWRQQPDVIRVEVEEIQRAGTDY